MLYKRTDGGGIDTKNVSVVPWPFIKQTKWVIWSLWQGGFSLALRRMRLQQDAGLNHLLKWLFSGFSSLHHRVHHRDGSQFPPPLLVWMNGGKTWTSVILGAVNSARPVWLHPVRWCSSLSFMSPSDVLFFKLKQHVGVCRICDPQGTWQDARHWCF